VAVGAPGEAVGTRSGAGAVTVFRGVAAGLTASGSQNWNQDTPAVPGAAESGDGFGTSVALGDFTLDGRADLVAGAPGEDVGAAANAGFANLLRGGSSLLITANAAGFSQSNVGQPIQAGANFGAAVVAKKGPLVTNGALIVGVPGQRGPSASDATGAIVSIGGGSDALNFGDVSYLHAYFFIVSGGADRRIGAILG
jgi:hypothetical protein